MKIHMFYAPVVLSNGLRMKSYDEYATWEAIIDRAGDNTLPFGHVEFFEFVTKPTKRQMRKLKKYFRMAVLREIDRKAFEDSLESIHCDVMGL